MGETRLELARDLQKRIARIQRAYTRALERARVKRDAQMCDVIDWAGPEIVCLLEQANGVEYSKYKS